MKRWLKQLLCGLRKQHDWKRNVYEKFSGVYVGQFVNRCNKCGAYRTFNFKRNKWERGCRP